MFFCNYPVIFVIRYHIQLVKLLTCCTMGKNVYTEIKCHSLLPLDDIVSMITHPDCIPEVSRYRFSKTISSSAHYSPLQDWASSNL